MLFWSENPTFCLPLIQIQNNLQKTAEMTYLKAKKQQTKYLLTNLDSLK